MSALMQVHNVLLQETAQSVDESVTKQVVSRELMLSSEAATRGIVVEAKVSAATVAVGISLIVQIAPYAGATYVDLDGTNAVVAITTTGWVRLPISPANTDFTDKFPLSSALRLVCTTGAGDAVTFSELRVAAPD